MQTKKTVDIKEAIEIIKTELVELERKAANRKEALAILTGERKPVSLVPTAKAKANGRKPVRKKSPTTVGLAKKAVKKPVKKTKYKEVTTESKNIVLTALGRYGEPASMSEIIAQCGFDGSPLAILQTLINEGKLVKTGAKRGTKYALAEKAEQ